jgi:hypothetical protein
MGLILGACLTLPCLVPCAVVYQDYCGGHYRKKSGHTCNDAVETQTLDQGDAL